AFTLVELSPAQAQSARPEAQEMTTVTDAELRSSATAAAGVKRVADSYLPLLIEVQNYEQEARAESAAYSDIKQTVENERFTVTRFNQILTLASASPDLADRIRSHMHSVQ